MAIRIAREIEASGTVEGPGLEALVVAARDRRPGAFDALARALAGRLTGFARRLLQDQGLAEEAVQETLVRVYRFLPRYREQNFLAWSFTIAHRACANIARRERRHARLHVDSKPYVAAGPDETDGVDVRMAVEDALSRIPQTFREVFLLHHQGLSYDDVAAILGVPVGTVRSRLFRAREALRAQLTTVLLHPQGDVDDAL